MKKNTLLPLLPALLLSIPAFTQYIPTPSSQFVSEGLTYEALIDSATHCGETQRWDDAILYWREALRRTPSSPLNSKIFTNLGICLFSAGDCKGADEAFDIALVRDSLSVKNLAYKGITSRCLGNDSIALKSAEKCLAIDSTQQTALRVRADIMLKRAEYPQAVHDYSGILRFSPDDPDALYGLGQALFDMDRFSDAIPHLQKALAAEESSDVRILLIESLLAADRLANAIDVANESIHIYPGTGDFYLLRGIANQKFHLNSQADQDRELAKKYGVDPQTIEKFLPKLVK